MMKRRGLLTDTRAREAYRVLSRWTDWWMARDYDSDGLPEYRHGNDSGWDNSTVFDGGFPVAAPDLSAYLVVQMDTLSVLADRLGRNRAAGQWKERANALRDRMVKVLWDGEQFVSRRAFTGDVFPKGDSLINFLPIVMGRRLPKAVRDKVAAGLEPGGRFVRDFGPATESPDSPLYVPDGYWRGPIWGPEAVIVVDGLARGGYKKQATQVARRYCEMCRRSGFAENFNALTGEPLRDKAYTWGSSAFLTLAHEFLR
jgi:glycogen debranching enzyme